MNVEIRDKCPFCGSAEGYMILERVHRYLMIDFDGEPKGASEDMTDYSGKRAICINCEKILPKKMFEENRND